MPADQVFLELSREIEAQGVSRRITLQMGTFSKGLGGFGAYVAGPEILIRTLVNRARGLIYSTALPRSATGKANYPAARKLVGAATAGAPAPA